MQRWIKSTLQQLAEAQLSGFIFKSKSPSSGLYRVKVFTSANSMPQKKGTGMFAAAFIKAFPDIPVEEEGRLCDPALRECFIDKVSAYSELQDLMNETHLKRGDLTDFHAAYKYCIMAHNSAQVSKLGHLLASSTERVENIALEYRAALMRALSTTATRRKHTNVLDHISGYFKQELSSIEKRELHEVIEGFHDGIYPLLAPLVLLRHYALIYDNKYLLAQRYLNPGILQLNCRF
jgi:uncharacterized protein YbgA (DUF1722 family)